MHALRFGGRLRTPLLIALPLLAIGAIAGGWNLWQGGRDRAAIAASNAAVLDIEALLSAMKDVETGERGFALVGEESYLDPYRTGLATAAERLRSLADTGQAGALPALVAAKQAAADRSIAMRRAGDGDSAAVMIAGGEGKRAMDAVRAEAARLQAALDRGIDDRAAREARRTWSLGAVSVVALLGASAALALYAQERRRAERRARALFDGVLAHAPSGLGFLDRTLSLRQANQALYAMLGLEPKSSALPAAVREALAPRVAAMRHSGTVPPDLELRVVGADGARRLVLGLFRVPGREEGFGVGLVAQDLTRRWHAERRLRRSEARLRTIVDSIPQLAWMTGADGAVLWCNRRWHDYTGTAPEAVEGWGWADLVHPDHAERVTAGFRAAVAAGGPWEDTFPLRHAGGGWRWFLSRAEPVREEADEEEEGRVTGWFGTNTDVTDMREAEEQLEAARDAAEASNRAKSQFLANMSHELRTPLSAVIGYTEMLEEEAADGAEPASMLEDLRKIGTNARHLLSLINDVLDLSKIEAGKMELEVAEFAVAPLLREVAQTVEALVARRANTLVVELGDDLGEMRSDAVKLRQCLFNLLGNAAKFTEGGTITLVAEREVRAGGDRLRFRVRDTGIGMTEEQLARLFTRFTQADSSTTRKFGGTGLGLALTRAFARRLGGDVEVESTEGVGTTFTLTLPVDAPADAAAEGGEALQPAAANLSAPVVLIIDDDPATRDLLARFLAREGFAARTASDGAAGLALARELRPAAVLLDVMMPRMDGWAVLSALKADTELAATPVIMVTMVQQQGLGFSLGAADYLTKPVQWDRLRAVLARFRAAPAETSADAPRALVMEADAAQRGELCRLLEAEGWHVAAVPDPAAAIGWLEAEGPPAVVLAGVEAGGGEAFALIRALAANAVWAAVPVIAVAGAEPDPAALDALRGRVRSVVPSEAEPPAELVAELRRLAPAPALAAAGAK